MTTKIDDHINQAISRLPQQHRGKVNIETFLTALVKPVQGIEDGLWQLLTERGIDNSVGAQLDRIGRIVNQDRLGLDDETYSRYLRARITVNRSNGLVGDLILVTELILNQPSALIVVAQQFPASVAVKIFDDPVDDDLANTLISFLRDTVSAGVRIILETTNNAEDDSFYFASGVGFETVFQDYGTGSAAENYSKITVSDAPITGFPSSGKIRIGVGTPNEEEVDYVGIATIFTTDDAFDLGSIRSTPHSANEMIQEAGPGKGFGEGSFASAKSSKNPLILENTHCLVLDSSQSQYVTVPDDPALDPDSITVGLWFRPRSKPDSGVDWVLLDRIGGGGGFRFYLIKSGTGENWLFRAFINGAYMITTSVTIATLQWSHLAFTYDHNAATVADAFTLIQDGVDVGGNIVVGNGADPPPPIGDSGQFLMIGARVNGTATIDADLDDLKIFDYAQTIQEVSFNKDREFNGAAPGLILNHKYNNDLSDSSGNGHDGTGVNGPTFSTDTPFK